MVKLIRSGVYYIEGRLVKESVAFMVDAKKQAAKKCTISHGILHGHNNGSDEELKLKFDYLVADWRSGEQVAKLASALNIKKADTPCIFVGENLSAAKKLGCDFVPFRTACPHQYVCETTTACGNLILNAEEHIGCGALGSMAIAEDSSLIVKQLINKPYSMKRPPVIAVYLKGKPKKGVGPLDVALEIISETTKKSFLKDCILEFIGFGVKNISVDFRMELDYHLGNTGCLATVWETDDAVKEYYKSHNRENDYKQLRPEEPAYYDGAIVVDLSRVEPMIGLRNDFNAYTVREFIERASEITEGKYESGNVKFSSGIIGDSGCESISEACEILKTNDGYSEFNLCIDRQDATQLKSITDNGIVSSLLSLGVSVGPALEMNIVDGKFIMDARTIAATAANGGVLTPATASGYTKKYRKFNYDGGIYAKKVYRGTGKPDGDIQLDVEPLSGQCELSDKLNIQVLIADEYGMYPDDVEEPEISGALTFATAIARSGEFVSGYELIDDGFSAVIAEEYSSERYRRNLINWGVLPFACRKFDFKSGDLLYIENLPELIKADCTAIPVKYTSDGKTRNIMLELPVFSAEEKKILLSGGLAYLNN